MVYVSVTGQSGLSDDPLDAIQSASDLGHVVTVGIVSTHSCVKRPSLIHMIDEGRPNKCCTSQIH